MLQVYNARKEGVKVPLHWTPLGVSQRESSYEDLCASTEAKVLKITSFEVSKRRLEDSSMHIHSLVSVS